MILRIIICCSLLLSTRCLKPPQEPYCLLGHMTEVQSWVSADGVLLTYDPTNATTFDLSSTPNPALVLQQELGAKSRTQVRFLSMARCRLTAVPEVFTFRTQNGTQLSQTLEFLTLFGNEFSDVTPTEDYNVTMNASRPMERTVNTPFLRRPSLVSWSIAFNGTEFPKLKELDLRACSIQVLDNGIFEGMPKLESLYIAENKINYIYRNAFLGLHSLQHLDFSYNAPCDDKGNELPLIVESTAMFYHLRRLSSLDLSRTKLTQMHQFLFSHLTRRMTRLSLCETHLTNLQENIFKNTSLRILDLSSNDGILNNDRSLAGLEDTLQILYAINTGLRAMDIFKYFAKLEILDLSINEIAWVEPSVTRTLKNLQILNLQANRLTTWFTPTFSHLKSLKLLSLMDNNINIIGDHMIEDMSDLEYIAISRNFIVCNCHSRDFMNAALHNEGRKNHDIITEIYNNNNTNNKIKDMPLLGHNRAFDEYNTIIVNRLKVPTNCTDCDDEIIANFLLLDYSPGVYSCLYVPESRSVDFLEVESCNRSSRLDYDTVLQGNAKKLYLLSIIPVLLLVLVLVYVFWRNLRYCLITVKNSTLLSLVHKGEFIDDTTIFHYDVFVSYCNEDRGWVLDHLLPHLESDCRVSACLHERDFQVGSSILENIVSCMDRSRSIMLIISRRFLLSQWCQFEMHLAQHRLLETRREDLTLVFLEEVPRRMRPNTLHYLMLTKTYILWPDGEQERKVFWRRLKKTLVMWKQKQSAVETVSIA